MASKGKRAGACYCHIYLASSCLIRLILWVHEIFKLIFLKPSSWPKTMYAEHWRKLAWVLPWEIFVYSQYNNSVELLVNSCVLEYAAVFLIKNKF